MHAVWQILGGNLAAVALTISLWVHVDLHLRNLSKLWEQIIWGMFIGIAIIASMMLAVELQPGVIVDLRSMVAVAGLFGGPVSALTAFVIGGSCRMMLGGAGAIVGVGVLGVMAIIGVCGHYVRKRGAAVGIRQIVGVSLAVAITTLVFFSQMPASKDLAFQRLTFPLVVLNIAAIWFCSAVVLLTRLREGERKLLRAALAQAPDYLYVKDRSSRFVVTNTNTARHNNYDDPDKMIGLTDFALAPAPRAEALYEAEQTIMRTGDPLTDLKEEIDGKVFLTTKVPVRDGDGLIIGLAGVTRDITELERLEKDLRDNRNLLTHALAGMSDGFALFDSKGFLVFCNDQYRRLFPLSGGKRVPGTHIKEIVREVVLTGERRDLPGDISDEWITKAAATLHSDKEEEFQLFNGTWLSLRTRRAEGGTAVVVASDITATKLAEVALRQSAESLRALAQTDGLTGIPNRRSFDEALKREISLAVGSRTQLSILMIDVDRFKAYNDAYGHQAGDVCLQVVAECLTASCGRSSDIVARYGGEEFVALLPSTSEEGAADVAQRFRTLLKARALPHQASEFEVVTASVGIASAHGWHGHIDSAGLVRKADVALYGAKANGRDQICRWSALQDAQTA